MVKFIQLMVGQLKNPTKIVQHGEIHLGDYLNEKRLEFWY